MTVADMTEVPNNQSENRPSRVKDAKAARGARAPSGYPATELLTVPEFADALSITPAAIRKWLYQGRLQPVKLGRSVRLRRRDLDRLVAEGLDSKKRLTETRGPRAGCSWPSSLDAR